VVADGKLAIIQDALSESKKDLVYVVDNGKLTVVNELSRDEVL
jgi:hypothetical protein